MLLFTRHLSVVALCFAAIAVIPVSLTAQQAQPRATEYRMGAGLTRQGSAHGSVANDLGAHFEFGIARRQSTSVAVGIEAAYHGFWSMSCQADQPCTFGADWITNAGVTALLGTRRGGIPVYAIGGAGAYYGGQSSRSATLRPGGSVGLGVVLLRRTEAMLSVDVRYHRFTSDVHGTRYMLPATLSLIF